MLLNVLTDLRKKKTNGGNQPDIGNIRVGNGLNGQDIASFTSTMGYAKGDNFLNYHLAPKPHKNGKNVHLAVEGVGNLITQQ
jgi:hypothetical protein